MPGQADSVGERVPGAEPVSRGMRALGTGSSDRRQREVRRCPDGGYVCTCRPAPIRIGAQDPDTDLAIHQLPPKRVTLFRLMPQASITGTQ
jgi:hypothetical protein